MFDTYLHRTVVERGGPSNVTVTEKRAPTDESVRLLKEMEAAALDKVLSAIPLKDNLLEGVLVERDSFSDLQKWFMLILKINGKRVDLLAKVDDDVCKDQHKMIAEVIKQFSEQLASQLLQRAVEQGIRRE